MKITASRSCIPSVEPELIARFVIKRCRKTIEQGCTEPAPTVVSLALALLAHDQSYYNRLKNLVSSSDEKEQILGMCQKVFVPALGQSPVLDESMCKLVLRYALSMGERLVSEKDFEFVNVFEFLIRSGLEPYSCRLYQFEAVGEKFKDDPEDLLRKGVEIIKDALGIPRNEN
jgi:hypothetical protein